MRLYLQSLRRLHSEQTWRVIFPGHGPPVAAAQHAIAEYISHREAREAQIASTLAQRDRSARGVTASELVAELYHDRVLSWELRQAATETVYNHLLFLREKGRVKCNLGGTGSRNGVAAGLGACWTYAH